MENLSESTKDNNVNTLYVPLLNQQQDILAQLWCNMFRER